MMRLDDTNLATQVGSEVVYVSREPIGAAAIRYFAEAIGDSRPEYLCGPESDASGPVAPPTLLFETNFYTGRRPDRNGYAGHAWDGIPDSAILIRGGNAYRMGRAVRSDDQVKVTWKLVGVRDVTTRDGKELVQVTSEADFFSLDGEWLGWNREVLFLADGQDPDARR